MNIPRFNRKFYKWNKALATGNSLFEMKKYMDVKQIRYVGNILCITNNYKGNLIDFVNEQNNNIQFIIRN